MDERWMKNPFPWMPRSSPRPVLSSVPWVKTGVVLCTWLPLPTVTPPLARLPARMSVKSAREGL